MTRIQLKLRFILINKIELTIVITDYGYNYYCMDI